LKASHAPANAANQTMTMSTGSYLV